MAEVTTDHDESYKIKRIQFFGRTSTPIFMQNVNGPCPLLALANVLSLRNQLPVIPTSTTTIGQKRLIAMVAERLVDSNLGASSSKRNSTFEANLQQNLSDSLDSLHKLAVGMDVNVRFNSIFGFEPTPYVSIFDLLDISLCHGWLVDPHDTDIAAVVGSRSYNELIELIITALEAPEQTQPLYPHHVVPPFQLMPFDSLTDRDAQAGPSGSQPTPGAGAGVSAPGLALGLGHPKPPPMPPLSMPAGGMPPLHSEMWGQGVQSSGWMPAAEAAAESSAAATYPPPPPPRPPSQLPTAAAAAVGTAQATPQPPPTMMADLIVFENESLVGRRQAAAYPPPPPPPAPSPPPPSPPPPTTPSGPSVPESHVYTDRRTYEALVARDFLNATCWQLTDTGLAALQSDLRPGQLAVFFRNNHFSVIFKHGANHQLYLLVTDQGYLNEADITWEHLITVDGNTQLCGPDFAPFKPHRDPGSLTAADAVPGGELSEADAAAIAAVLAEDEAQVAAAASTGGTDPNSVLDLSGLDLNKHPVAVAHGAATGGVSALSQALAGGYGSGTPGAPHPQYPAVQQPYPHPAHQQHPPQHPPPQPGYYPGSAAAGPYLQQMPPPPPSSSPIRYPTQVPYTAAAGPGQAAAPGVPPAAAAATVYPYPQQQYPPPQQQQHQSQHQYPQQQYPQQQYPQQQYPQQHYTQAPPSPPRIGPDLDADLALALRLQEEEEEAARTEAQQRQQHQGLPQQQPQQQQQASTGGGRSRGGTYTAAYRQQQQQQQQQQQRGSASQQGAGAEEDTKCVVM